MKFLLSDSQQELFDAVRGYALGQCDAGVRRAAFESETGFDDGFWKGLLALGVGSILVEERHGGLGLGMMDAALAAEALGFAGAPGPFLGHLLATYAIGLAGSDAQKARWLPALARGDITATIALAEEGETARPDQWTAALSGGALSGRKRDVLYPEFADLTVVGDALS